MTFAVDPPAVLVMTVVLPAEVDMMTTTVGEEEGAILLVMMTATAVNAITALVILVTTMVVLAVLIVTLPVKIDMGEAVLVAARTGTAAVVMIAVLLASLTLTVTVTAATPVPHLRMLLLADLKAAAVMADTRMIAAVVTGGRCRDGLPANYLSADFSPAVGRF